MHGGEIATWAPRRGAPRSPRPRRLGRRHRLAATVERRAQPPSGRDLAVSAPAQGQPRRLASVGRRGARAVPTRGSPTAGVDRLLGLPLVPRDGARVVRGSRHGGRDERALCLHQGGSRGAARHRRHLHGGLSGDNRPRRMATERVPDPRAAAILRRHLLPARATSRDAELAHGARRDLRCVGEAP